MPVQLHQALVDQRFPPLSRGLLDHLSKIIGEANVHVSLPARLAYARDRLPYATFSVRAARLPGTLPAAVVCPGSHEELSEIFGVLRREGVRAVPYGAGSGVLGGAIPLAGEVSIDLKRMNQILSLNAVDGTVTVQCGMNGGQFEEALAAGGWTCGHLPQSLYMSTVGGWAACRGAGQASSRYGKIEDMVIGLRAVLPDGRSLEVRPAARRAAGPSIKDIFVGSEGVFGVITELTLRIWKKPEIEHGCVLALPSLQSGFDGLREIMQSELRPSVTRLYDLTESRDRTAGIPEFEKNPFLCILVFSGPTRLAALEEEMGLEIMRRHGAVKADDAPLRHWQQNRFLSYSPKYQAGGFFMDTIEITGAWSALPLMYERMKSAAMSIHPEMHFGTHWSHSYPEGACQYMTVRLPPMPMDEALGLHRNAWDKIQRLTLELGGSISHHHGVGAFRNQWLREELNAGMDILQGIKDTLDPDNLVNPGRLALRPAAGAREL